MQQDKSFGKRITRLIDKADMTRNESRDAFTRILKDETTPMQQGAFLAALRAKGETAQEVAGAWEAIYQLDTTKVTTNAGAPLVENSGTGMDTFKTFNISTAAAIVAASAGVRMARHGARAITSVCGTVDMAEALGVDVECDADLVAHSISGTNIGLFNGMSPKIHPMALGRILSQIHFGSTLNIAASLANPAMPRTGARGVYSRMDEASVCGTTWCAELNEQGHIHEFILEPSKLELSPHDPAALRPESDLKKESRRFVALIRGEENGNGARRQAVELNTALILKVAGKTATIASGMDAAAAAIDNGNAWRTLEGWVASQNREPETGLVTLRRLQN
ncbi:MAG: anthranilate phosphoribosyltransferase [Desulfosarcina sp.]|nr:anthranilate phosphoribosyltransferase [Desulfosarcina sp.]